MGVENRNLHVVFDGHWAIAAEGEGRLQTGLDLTSATALATALAMERKALLYIHHKDGWIAERIDCSVATPDSQSMDGVPNGEPHAELSECDRSCVQDTSGHHVAEAR